MSPNGYKISYGPSLSVKDLPHRDLDTARATRDTLDFNAFEAERSVVIAEIEAVNGVNLIEHDEPEIIDVGTD